MIAIECPGAGGITVVPAWDEAAYERSLRRRQRRHPGRAPHVQYAGIGPISPGLTSTQHYPAGGFTPPDAAHLTTWLEQNTLGDVDSGIASWLDQSASPQTWAQPTGGYQPVVGSYMAVKNAMFNGTDSNLSGPTVGTVYTTSAFTTVVIFNLVGATHTFPSPGGNLETYEGVLGDGTNQYVGLVTGLDSDAGAVGSYVYNGGTEYNVRAPCAIGSTHTVATWLAEGVLYLQVDGGSIVSNPAADIGYTMGLMNLGHGALFSNINVFAAYTYNEFIGTPALAALHSHGQTEYGSL